MSNNKVEATYHPSRCHVWQEIDGYVYECSRNAGHEGEHRAHVSDDLARAYVLISPGQAGE